MAAYAALVSLMHIIDDLENHHSPPIHLYRKQVQSLSQNVMFLQKFLEGYISPVADGDEADPLEMRIADAAYAAQDVIESHIVNKTQPRLRPFLPRSKKSKNASSSSGANCHDEKIKLYQDLQKVIEEMNLIRREAMEIDTEKVVIHDQGHSFVPIASLISSSSSIGKKSSSMVCSDDVLLEILDKLTGAQLNRLVIPIVGMGGIGKTTLARTVYSKPLIKEHFDICAWATISQQYDTREILCEILSQATNKKKEELSGRREDEVGLELYQHLIGRRFLIVLDDMWSVDAWDKIQRFFPNDNKGSRVVVTTRLSQLGSQLNNEYSHQMEFLDEANSWLLFSKTVFGENNYCPPELEEIGKKIIENCRGLPLSIVVVGGILKSMEHSKGCWEPIRKNLTSIVNLENDKHCLRLLKLSYDNLPVYLKPYFLYMGVFEEDDEIKVSTLVKLWVGERFLKSIDGKSLETIAKGFLKDLIDRNLILIDDLGSAGNIKSVKVHDLLRDLCLSEVKKEGFYHVVGQCSPPGISRQRRVVIRRNTSEKEVVDELQCKPNARSVICENGKLPRRWQNMGLLRTLHAYKDKSHVKYSLELQQYVNLQHLAVGVDSIPSNFASINLLWNLHTLIVSCPSEHCHSGCSLPAEIWKMPQLRHIEFDRSRFHPDPPRDVHVPLGSRFRSSDIAKSEMRLRHTDPPIDGVIMENLQTLKGVHNFKCGEEVVKRIPNIKKLGIRYFNSEGMKLYDDYCLRNIKCLHKLESLDINCWRTFRGNALHKLICPHSLKSLTLSMKGGFKWEGILKRIGWLPNLEKFKMWKGCFGTGKWKVVESQFPNLKYLELYACNSMKEWRAETEGSSIFPRLEKLYLYDLRVLNEIPSEIGDITTLQRIELQRCSELAAMCAKAIVDQQVELQGDELPFHVHVTLLQENEAVQSLAGPNFEVTR